MIPIETWYKTYNDKLLAIIKTLKTYRYYLESYKHKVYILTDYKNCYWFINIKNLGFQ